jgi:hypothetical protein
LVRLKGAVTEGGTKQSRWRGSPRLLLGRAVVGSQDAPRNLRIWQRTREVRWQRFRTLPAPGKGRTSTERRRCSFAGRKLKCQVGHVPYSFQGRIEPSFFLLALGRNPRLQRDPQTTCSGTKHKDSAGDALTGQN